MQFHTNWYTNSSCPFVCCWYCWEHQSSVREVISWLWKNWLLVSMEYEESCSVSPSDGMVRILSRDENMDSDIYYMKLYPHRWSWSISKTSANSITHSHKCYPCRRVEKSECMMSVMCVEIHMVLNELRYQSGQSLSRNWKRDDEWMNGLLS